MDASSSALVDALCAAAEAAKAAYETAYESAELRGGAELTASAGGEADATIGEVAQHAITQCEWVIEQCRGLPHLPPPRSPLQPPKPSSSALGDDMPDWLLSAEQQLAPPPAAEAPPPAEEEVSVATSRGPVRSESFNRRRRRTRKTGD